MGFGLVVALVVGGLHLDHVARLARLAQAIDDFDGDDVGGRHGFFALGHMAADDGVEAEELPEPACQPHIAEAAGVAPTDLAKVNADDIGIVGQGTILTTNLSGFAYGLARPSASCRTSLSPGVSHHVDEVPGSDTKFPPRKLTASIFREKTLEITGSLAVNFRGEFSSPVRGGRLAIRKHRHFILKGHELSPAPVLWVPRQLLLEVTPQAALFGPGWNQSDRLQVA